MLTKRQKETVDDWENKNEHQKQEVRDKLRKSVADLPLLRELPPEEARKIAQSAVVDYAEIDGRSKLSDKDEEQIEKHSIEDIVLHERYDIQFIKNSIGVLYNSLPEEKFEEGVNEGIEDAVKWWINADVGDLYNSHDIIGEDFPMNIGRNTDGRFTNRTISPTEPPRSLDNIDDNIGNNKINREDKISKERLARIFHYRDRNDLIKSDILDVLAEKEVFEKDIEEIKPYSDDEKQAEEINKHPPEEPSKIYSDLHNKLIDAKKVINESRETAEYVARSMKYPRNAVFSTLFNNPKNAPPLIRWLCRESIELHRDYLEEEGLLPSDSKMVEYPDVNMGIPKPSELDLRSWEKDRDF